MRRTLALIGLSSLVFLAACGDAGAADYQKGLMYWRGEGVEKNEAKAVELFLSASNAGSADADLTLGYLYLKGEGGMKADQTKAIELFTKAAELGSVDAQYNLGLAYVRGQGVAVDLAKGYEWFLKAAGKGDPGAQYNVGVMLWNGEGTAKNGPMAWAWFTLAQEGGDAGAKQELPGIGDALSDSEKKEAQTDLAELRKTVQVRQAPASQPKVMEVNGEPKL